MQLARKNQLPPSTRDPRRSFFKNKNRDERRQRAAADPIPLAQPQILPPRFPQASASSPAIPFAASTSSIPPDPNHTPSFQELPNVEAPLEPTGNPPIIPSSQSSQSAPTPPLVQSSASTPAEAGPLAIMPPPPPISTSSAVESQPWGFSSLPASQIPTIIGVSDPQAWRDYPSFYFTSNAYEVAPPSPFEFMMNPPILWPTTPPVIDRELLQGMADVQLYDPQQILQQHLQQIQQLLPIQQLQAAAKGNEPPPPGE